MKMMILQVLCLAMLAVASESVSLAAVEHVPLAEVWQIVPDFPETDFCSRTCYSKYWLETGNVRNVQFTGTLNKNETPRQLCSCLYSYMNQGTWLLGATPRCVVQCNRVTLILTGKPDATYDPTCIDKKYDRPCEKLREIADQFKNNAKLIGFTCTMSHTEDACGCIHVMVSCPKNGDSRSKDVCCDGIKSYFNQGKNLDNTVIHCNQRGDTLEMEFVGRGDSTDVCPTVFQYGSENEAVAAAITEADTY